MIKLKPCVVFDLDDTLFHTPDVDWNNPSNECMDKIKKATPIVPNVFLYHAIDYMINDERPEGLDWDSNWPKEIFFCTARPDYFREPTVQALVALTKDAGSSINKRLIMRPFDNIEDLSHKEINTPKESKAWSLEQVKKRGYMPVMAFDNSGQAVAAYIEGGVEVMQQTIATIKDRKKALNRYAI